MNLALFEKHELDRPLPAGDERVRHLKRVLGKKAGDTFEAGVIDGKLGRGYLKEQSADGGLIIGFEPLSNPPPRLALRVAVGFPRPIQLRRLLRDLSSLGVAGIDLVGTDLGEKSYRDTKLLSDGGARAALVEGAAQARDTRLPELSVFKSLEAWLSAQPWPPGAVLVAPDNVRPSGSFFQLTVKKELAHSGFVLCVGSERGWTDRERTLLEERGFKRLSMGGRALRTETACVAAVVLGLERLDSSV